MFNMSTHDSQIRISDGSKTRDTISLVLPTEATDELRTLFDNQFVTLNQIYCSDYEFDTSRKVVSDFCLSFCLLS